MMDNKTSNRVIGFFIGFFWFLFNFFNNLLNNNPTDNMTMGRFLLIGMIVAFVLFGMVAAGSEKQTRKAVLAGMVFSFVGVTTGLVLVFLFTYLFFDLLRNNPYVYIDLHTLDRANQRYTFEDNLGSSFFITVFGLIFGALASGIGSIFSRQKNKTS